MSDSCAEPVFSSVFYFLISTFQSCLRRFHSLVNHGLIVTPGAHTKLVGRNVDNVPDYQLPVPKDFQGESYINVWSARIPLACGIDRLAVGIHYDQRSITPEVVIE